MFVTINKRRPMVVSNKRETTPHDLNNVINNVNPEIVNA